MLDGDGGRFTAADVEAAIQVDDPHFPRTRLVTHLDISEAMIDRTVEVIQAMAPPA